MNNKKFYIFIILILIIFFTPKIYATDLTTKVIQEEQNKFGINDFINETKKYTTDFFEDINVSEILNSAIKGRVDNNTILKRILNIFNTEIVASLKTLLGVLVIVLIHSILKTVADDLETSNISEIIYYVQYILIVTLIMSNFSNLISEIINVITNLVGFMNILVPILITLMIYTGSITTGGLLEPIMLFVTQFTGNIIISLIIPAISIVIALTIVSKISDKVQVKKLAKFMKSSIVWFLGLIITVFVGVVSLEGTLTSSVDGITAKTAKAAVSSMIPVVRKNIRRFS